jgi:type IV secretory pathway TraG/TraD family ATPase VirD4
MAASKFQWDQIIIAMAIVLVALWAATQKTAWQLGFTPRFGHAWFGLWRMPVYPRQRSFGGGSCTPPMRRRSFREEPPFRHRAA